MFRDGGLVTATDEDLIKFDEYCVNTNGVRIVVKLAIRNAITNPNESPKQKLRLEVCEEPHIFRYKKRDELEYYND